MPVSLVGGGRGEWMKKRINKIPICPKQLGTYEDALLWEKYQLKYIDYLEPHIKTNVVTILNYLIKELRPISADKLKTETALSNRKKHSKYYHSYECLVVIQGILGIEFVEKCNKDKPSTPLKYHRPSFSKGKEEPFYKYWMSRDMAYFAPIETQNKIITKIKSYVKEFKENTTHQLYYTNRIILRGLGLKKTLIRY